MDSSVPVRDVMDRTFVGVSESDTVGETAELLLSEGADSVVVLRGDEPVGVVTERDALGALVADEGDEPVSNAMTESVPTIPPDATLGEAADEMSSQTAQRVVVSNGSRPVGLLSEHDLITTSPFAPERRVTAGPDTAAASHRDERVDADEPMDRGFEDQSICEACGALARDLSTFNGQLLCGDCRDI